MNILPSLVSGFVGSVALTATHEIVRRVLPEAPRVDILGMRAIAAGLRAGGKQPPPSDELFNWALVGDLISNGVYYSLVGLGKRRHAMRRGALLGAGAGVAAVVVPPLVGLGSKPQARTPLTAVLTFTWYLLGGLVAAATVRQLMPERRSVRPTISWLEQTNNG